nr:hypothetical protein [Tanacetum cinerariifolium]
MYNLGDRLRRRWWRRCRWCSCDFRAINFAWIVQAELMVRESQHNHLKGMRRRYQGLQHGNTTKERSIVEELFEKCPNIRIEIYRDYATNKVLWGDLADPKGMSYESSSGSLYQVNLLENLHKEGRHHFLKNWNNRFFWVDECVFPTAVEWRTNASKGRMPTSGTYSVEAVRVLDTHRAPIQKQPEALLCLVEMDLFSLIRALNPTKMDEPAAATDSSGVPSAIERETAAPEMPPPEEVPSATAPGGNQAAKTAAVEPPAVRESRKMGHEGIDANAPPKSLRRDHADLRPSDFLGLKRTSNANSVWLFSGLSLDRLSGPAGRPNIRSHDVLLRVWDRPYLSGVFTPTQPW